MSRQTVSNAINHPERLAELTMARVQRAIDDLGFMPNAAAQHLSRRGRRPTGSRSTGPGWVGWATSSTASSSSSPWPRRGYESHLVTFAPDGDRLLEGYDRILGSGLVDGFFLGDTRHDDPRPAWLLDNGVPFVTFGRIWDRPELGRWVDVNGHAGMELAVGHLADQGYESIAYLGWPHGSPVGDDRRLGWLAGLADAGLDHDPFGEEAVEDVSDAAARGRHPPRPPRLHAAPGAPSSAPPTCWRSAHDERCAAAASSPGSTSASSASTTAMSPTRSG